LGGVHNFVAGSDIDVVAGSDIDELLADDLKLDRYRAVMADGSGLVRSGCHQTFGNDHD